LRLETWMIVGAGIAFAVGFGAVTVLLLALHAEVRRLSRLADSAQRGLVANLRQTLPSENTPPPARRLSSILPVHSPYVPPPPPPESEEETALPIAKLSAATIETASVAVAERAPEPESVNLAGWNPDRRLLVMRLASRGKKADQIGAALRIPQQEVDQFLEANNLAPRHSAD
jgi:hypothetical protein